MSGKFWRLLWEEIAPIVRHLVAILALMGILVVIYVVASRVGRAFPELSAVTDVILYVDKAFISALVVMFAVYTLVKVAKVLVKDLWDN